MKKSRAKPAAPVAEPGAIRFSDWIPVAIAAAIGFLLRVWDLGRCALHNDEALQKTGILTDGWDALLRHITKTDLHPPISYLCGKIAAEFGTSEAALRFPSVIAGTLVIVALWWAWRPLVGQAVAVGLAACAAVYYPWIWFSREIRSYIFFILLATVAFGCFVRLLRAPRERSSLREILLFIAAGTLCVYSHYNTYLTWPVYVAMAWAWVYFSPGQDKGRWWRLADVLLCVAMMAVLAWPTYGWFESQRSLQGTVSERPDLVRLWNALAGLGFGTGWRGVVWWILTVSGMWYWWRRDRRVAALAILWTFAPVIGLLYVKGVPAKFIYNFSRYMPHLATGWLLLVLGGILSAAAALGKGLRFPPKWALVAVGAVLIAMQAPIFRAYYSLESVGTPYRSIQSRLESFGTRGVLIDNYYDMQYLRHYLPGGISLAYPPVFDSLHDYTNFGCEVFLQRVVAENPLLVFYDTGFEAREWPEGLFRHKAEFPNRPAWYLWEQRQNLFSIIASANPNKPQVHRMFWNEPGDVADALTRSGVRAAAFWGGQWRHMTFLTTDRKWRHLCVTRRPADLLVFWGGEQPGRVPVRLRLHSCAPGAELKLSAVGGPAVSIRPEHGTVRGFDFRAGKPFEGAVAFGELSDKSLFWVVATFDIPFAETVVELPVQRGWNTFRLDGIPGEGVVADAPHVLP